MSKHRRVTHDLGSLADDARALMTATADVTGEKVEQARKRLEAALEKGADLYEEAKDKAAENLKSGDKYIRENPYAALGIGVGVGVLIGFLLARRK
jgi:ElaB/YqjD/DUF883 family membrane-anchored ribosome-binding protein